MLKLYPNAISSVVGWTTALMITFAVLAVTMTGCVSGAAIDQARTEKAVNQGHANDGQLPPKARLIGQDNYDAWSAQLYNLDGTRLPADTVRRLSGRGQLPEGYEAGE